MATEQFSFQGFAQQSFYTEVNRRLVERAGLRPGQAVVDLACGTGAVSRLILEKLHNARRSVLIAIDESASALRQAREGLQDARNTAVQFVQGQAEHLSTVVRRRVDAVFLCNAIHLFPNKDHLLDEVGNVLGQGGVFAFNSAFFRGTNPPETDRFYRRWILRSQRILRRDFGLTPVQEEKVEARKHLSMEEYTELLHAHGFEVKEAAVMGAEMPLEAWLAICSFGDFVSGIMPGVPLAQASAALKQAVTEVFEELDLKTVQRNWLQVIAVRA